MCKLTCITYLKSRQRTARRYKQLGITSSTGSKQGDSILGSLIRPLNMSV